MKAMKAKLKAFTDLRDELAMVESELRCSINDLVAATQTSIWDAERAIYKKYKYDYAATCYQFAVPHNYFDDYTIEMVFENHFTARCRWQDEDGETFKWTLNVPYDPSEITSRAEEFTKAMTDFTEEKIKRKILDKEYIDRQEYNKLKARFEFDDVGERVKG